MEINGQLLGGLLVAFSILMSYLVSQTSNKSRDQRARLRRLTKRDIAWAKWGHRVQVWAAQNGYDDLPDQPAELTEDEEE